MEFEKLILKNCHKQLVINSGGLVIRDASTSAAFSFGIPFVLTNL